MKPARFLLCVLTLVVAVPLFAQEYEGKRIITLAEVQRLAHHRDTLITALNNLYKLEKKQNSPGKYQPERISLVRQYILIFDQIAAQTAFVYYNTYSIRTILGKPDHKRTELGYEIWEYDALQTRFLSIKNIRYSFVFRNDELIHVKRD